MGYSVPPGLGDMEALKKRARASQDRDISWRDLLDDAYEFFLPQRDQFTTHAPGQKKDERIFDSTPNMAIKEGASRIQANIAPIYKQWAKFNPGVGLVQQIQAGQSNLSEQSVRQLLQRSADIVFEHINQSNFATQFNEMALDLLIGTGALIVNEGEGEQLLEFATIPQNKCSFEQGPSGRIETVWRTLKVRARDVERKWPGFKASSKVAKIIQDKPDTELCFTEGVVFDPTMRNEFGEVTRQYWGVVFEEGDRTLSWLQDYQDSSPWVVGRWAVVAGEVRGRGPAIDALPDAKTVNLMERYLLQKAALDIGGMWTATDDGITNPYNVRIEPGIIIPVQSNSTTAPSIQRLDTASNLQLPIEELNARRINIKKALFNDLRDPTGPVRSATEIAIMQREFAEAIGSAFGRLQNEILIPILTRVVKILQRRGKLPLFELDGKQFKAIFTSPLASAQNSEDLISVQQAIEFTAATAGPEMIGMGYKLEEIPTFAAEKLGIDQRLVRSEEEKTALAEQAADIASQQAEAGIDPSGGVTGPQGAAA